ncbi:MAG: hypothetical protein OWU33_13605 [Firmicutes bacterium]|nr:hypothetical protein [Bacillota bacterium]
MLQSKHSAVLKLHLYLFPEPYIGLIDAPIVLLALNPGFDNDDPEWHKNPAMRKAVVENFTEVPRPYPFYPLNPKLANSPVAKWWGRLLAPWLTSDPKQRQQVANRILAVDLFPYHSRQCGVDLSDIQTLYSYRYTCELVSNAMDRGALILILRSERNWQDAVPKLTKYSRVYHLTVGGRWLS